MDKKPATWGAEVIRVLDTRTKEKASPSGFVYFYDIAEAEKFVRTNWKRGQELSARVQNGTVWETVFGITEDGTIFVSPDYHRVASRATRIIGKVFESV